MEYEFTLAELWDNQMDPQAAFLARRPLYQTNTFSNTLLYGPGETSLLPDKTYAWRVRAIVNDGISETSVFKNNGYSEIYHFTYTGSCAEPEYVLAESKNTTTEKILWQGVDHKRFNVQYRKKGVGNSIWFDSPTVNNYTSIYNLEPGTSYQFRVGGQCMVNGPFTYSQIFEFTTNTSTDQGSNFNCGITPEIVIHNQDPLASMVINETFTAGDFPVTVKEVNGANGTFSGWGYIVVPYLEDTRLKVSFDNIRINTEYQLMEGIVVTDYDENWGGVDDIGDEIDAVTDTVDTISDEVAAIIDAVFGTNDGNDDTESGNTASDSEANYSTPNKEDDPSTNPSHEKGDGPATGNTNNTSNNSETTNETTNNDSETTSDSPTEVAEVFILYNGKQYKHGDVIEVPYNQEKSHFAFSLKNHPKNSTFNWQVLHMGTDNTSAYAQNETIHDNFGIDMKNIFALDVVANYNDKKILVTIQRKSEEFKLLELYALHGEKRLAKSGQILYLVNPPSVTKDTKNVKYGLSINPDIDENLLSRNSIKWSYDGENQYFPTARTNVTRSLQESDNIIATTVLAGSPTEVKKNVDVKWIDEKTVVKSFSNKITNFLSFFEVINEVSDAAGKVIPCSATLLKNFDKNLKFQWTEYNIEDDESRHLLNHKSFEFVVGAENLAKLKCGKELKASAFGYNLSLGEIYVELNAGLNLSIIDDDIYYLEENKFKQRIVNSQGGIEVTGEVGLKIGGGIKNDEGNLIVGLEGAGKIAITGGGRIEYPYRGNKNEIAGELYINPMMYTFTATVRLGPLEKDFSYSDILWDIRKKKSKVYNMETGEMR